MSEKQKDGRISIRISTHLFGLILYRNRVFARVLCRPPLKVLRPAQYRFCIDFHRGSAWHRRVDEFRKARTTLDPHGSVHSLVMNGVYRFTRPFIWGFAW